MLSMFPAISQAQVLYGSITGTVTDPSGAAVSGARVEALNIGTGVTQAATTNESGIYRYVVLQPGTYKVTISAPGFATQVTENVSVVVNNVVRVDAALKIAPQQQALTVTAEAPLLQTDKADVHTELTSKHLDSLPINSSQGRSFQALYRLVPGTSLPQEANSAAGNPQRAISANANGQSVQGSGVRIDGALDAYPWLPQNVAYVPPADAIETVNVVTNSFDAEQGMAGAASVNVQIKSGTNQFHGTLHEFHTDNALRALDYFSPDTLTIAGVTKPFKNQKNIQNQMGGTIGGPIIKDKLFFFFDYERTTQRQFANATRSVPTAAMHTGDFSAFIPAGTDCNATPVQGCIFDPNTGNANGTGRTAFPGNIIPDARIDPAARALAARTPLPNLSGASNNQNNYAALGTGVFTRPNLDVKINYIPTSKSTFFGRYSLSRSHIFDPNGFGDPNNPQTDWATIGGAGGDAINGGQLGTADSRIQSVGLGATYSFTPSILADWNFGFTRQRLGAQNTDVNKNFGLDVLGIQGTNGAGVPGGTGNILYGGMPSFQFTLANGNNVWGNLGNANTGNPFLFRDNQYVSGANLSWIRGRHGFRFGIEYDHTGLNHFQPQGGNFQTARGTFGFDGNVTALSGGPAVNQYNSYAQFLLGLPGRAGKAIQNVNPIALRWTQWAWYARDQWQILPKLTLNVGVRWEYYPMAYSDSGGARVFDPKTGNVYVGGHGNIPVDDFVDVGSGQFLPRLGVAYRISDKTVIRAGYGMSADPNNFRFLRNSYPAVTNTNFTGANTFAPAVSLTGQNATGNLAALTIGLPTQPVPDVSSGVIPLPFSSGTTTLANPYHRGYINSFNLMLQREFAGFVAEAGYVGARAIRPLTNININAGPITAQGTSSNTTRLLNVAFGLTCSTSGAPTCYTSDINSEIPFRNNYYDSLQSKITRRFGEGSQVGAVYTFSKTLNYSDNEELNFLLFPYPAYWNKAKGPASFDRTHNLQIYGLYELPFGYGKAFAQNGVASQILGGWQLNGVMSLYSGLPFTVTASGNILNAAGNTETADLVAPFKILNGQPLRSGHSCAAADLTCHYFDPTSFAAPPTPATGQLGRFGNTGRFQFRGPGLFNLDVSVFRNFKITERVTFRFEAEAFSVTNTPHFSNPNVSCCGTNFGVITSTIGGNSGTNLNGARALWFAGKLTF